MNWSDLLDVDPTDAGVELLNENTTLTKLNKSEILIHQDSRIEHVYLVRSGLLQAKFVSFEGSEVWLANLGPGAIVGEISALGERLSSANVEAAKPTEVFATTQSAFLKAMERSSHLAIAIAKMLAKRIADTSSSLTAHVALKIEDRLLNALKTLAVPGDGESGAWIAPPPTISELAVRIHASREATSRAFAQLVKRGVVEKFDTKIVLKPPKDKART